MIDHVSQSAQTKTTSLLISVPTCLQPILSWSGCLIALLGLILSFFQNAESWQTVLYAVLVNLGGTLWLLARFAIIRIDGKYSCPITPLTMILAMYAFRRFLSLFNLGIMQGESYFYGLSYSHWLSSQVKAEYICLLGTASLVLGWKAFARFRKEQPLRVVSGMRFDRLILISYALSWVVYFMGLYLPVGSIAGSFIETMGNFTFGAIAFLLFFSPRFGLMGPKKHITYGLIALSGLNLFTMGSKGAFMALFFPVIIAFFVKSTKQGLIILTCSLLFLLIFVYPYVQTYREVNWNRKEAAAPIQILADVRSNIKQQGYIATISNSFEQLTTRLGGVGVPGMVVSFVDILGFQPKPIFAPLVYGWIPRMFWPEKPKIQIGGWFSTILGITDKYGNPTSSTAPYLATEWYFAYGWLAVCLGMFVTGVFFHLVAFFYLQKIPVNPVHFLGYYQFLIFCLLLEERKVSTCFLGTVILILATIFFSKIVSQLMALKL